MSSSSSSNNHASSHYQAHSAETYEKAYFYEPGAYQHYLVNLVGDRLRLNSHPPRHVLDIGGGTGNFAYALLQNYAHQQQHCITVVDPFLDPTTTTTEQSGPSQVSFVKESAETFIAPSNPNHHHHQQQQNPLASWRTNFQQVLLKEVVHHLSDRVQIFQGLYRELQTFPGPLDSNNNNNDDKEIPSLLIVTRPQIEIDYPLWDAARQVWKENQPSAEDLCQELEQAGFSHISQTTESYPCQISLERWKTMIQQRFWSTFSKFSNDELQQACSILEKEHAHRLDDNKILHFEDRLVLISAKKV